MIDRHQRLLWFGAPGSGTREAGVLRDAGFAIDLVTDAGKARRLARQGGVAAVLVQAEWSLAPRVIRTLMDVLRDTPIICVSAQPVPVALMRAIDAGATRIMGAQRDKIVGRLREVLDAAERTGRENQLLLKLRDLSDEFLRTLVKLEERNLLLEKNDPARSSDVDLDNLDSPGSVLIVDDEASIRRFLDIVLQDRFQVTTCETGEEALQLMAAHRFHVAIVDKNLPGISGLQVLKEIKRDHPRTDVIVITGYSSKNAAIEAINSGATAYLEKPFSDVHAIGDKVATVVRANQGRQQRRRVTSLIKRRNHEFLERYSMVRSELDALLEQRGLAAEE